jgi:chemotaxis family two-component system sensor kinase Cph1
MDDRIQGGFPFLRPRGADQEATGPAPIVTLPDSSGLVHAHGIVIGASSKLPDAVIVSISDSCEALWGLRPEEILGRPVVDFIRWAKQRRVTPGVERLGPIRGTDFQGAEWFVTMSFRFGQPMVHLEPMTADADVDATLWLATSIERIEYIDQIDVLWEEGCENIRDLIGFDRTMAVRIHGDGHGEVIAESLGGELASCRDMRFPPTTAPDVEHVQFMSVRSVGAHDVSEVPSLVVPRVDPDGMPWDLALSPLRRPVAARFEITRSLGAAASFILHVAGLDGTSYAIVSHSKAPRAVTPLVRSATELYARSLHARVDALQRSIDARRRAELAELQRRIVDHVDTNDIATSLTESRNGAPDMLELVAADAAIISIGDDGRVLGTLDEREFTAIDDTVRVWLETLSRHGALMTDHARQLHPKLAIAAPNVAGLLAASIGSQGDYLCWVRRPVERTVQWFGGIDPVAPDGSAAPVVEQITDRSEEWTLRDRLSAESLAREMEDTMLRRAQVELAQLALVDALTGLPNRRLVLDRVEKAIGRAERGHHFTLLFLDLNDFKAINDRYGHQVGDEVLVETARRLESAIREGDTVARLAGDEFVILCEDTRPGEEPVVAARIRERFAEPFVVNQREFEVKVAVGVADLELGLDAPSLLDRADRAMYSAKSAMKRA